MTATTVPPTHSYQIETDVGTSNTPSRRVAQSIPTTRLIKVELRKMFNTRSGFWMLISIGVLSILATGAVLIFAPDSDINYDSFTVAIGYPMSVILPMIAILGVTSEWSQRGGLTTFTLVPSRGHVIRAKAIATVLVGIGSTAATFAIGALGNLLGSAATGTDLVWDVSLTHAGQVVLANVVAMAIGFTLGVVLRNSVAAIVGYFVISLVLPLILGLLASARDGFAKLQPWIDINFTQWELLGGMTNTREEWAMLTTTTALWIVAPLAIGWVLLRRSEVK